MFHLFIYIFFEKPDPGVKKYIKKEVIENPLKQGVLDHQGESPARPVTRYLI